jgi:E3 ubiquitin-protein ligase RNF146
VIGLSSPIFPYIRRRNDPRRRRRIKRDLATGPRKGVAGIRLDTEEAPDDSVPLPNLPSDDPSSPDVQTLNSPLEESNALPVRGVSDVVTHAVDNNEGEEGESNSDGDDDIIHQLNSLVLPRSGQDK